MMRLSIYQLMQKGQFRETDEKDRLGRRDKPLRAPRAGHHQSAALASLGRQDLSPDLTRTARLVLGDLHCQSGGLLFPQ
jgi:hypothetical protein